MSHLAGVDGKGIVITGGAGGVGAAMCAELCRLGARVVAVDRDMEIIEQRVLDPIEGELGPGKAFGVVCDIREPDQVAAMADEAERVLGRVDGLVNNASGLFPIKAEELTPNGFNSVIRIILNGTWHCTAELAKRWIAAGRPGAIVNTLTPYAWMGAPGIVHNAAGKGGVLTMTRTLGVEWAPKGIRVNAIAPGWMWAGGTPAMVRTEEDKERFLKTVPMGRFLRPEETARAVAYLLSDDAAFVTGHCLTIDGGHHLSKGLYEFLDELPERES